MIKGKFENKIYQRKTIEKYDKKIAQSGINTSVYDFLNFRMVSTVFLLGLMLILDVKNIVPSIIITVLYFYLLPKICIDYQIGIRKNKLEKEALFFFEVLTLSLESGRNLLDSIQMAVNNTEGDLKKEFEKVLKEIKYGKDMEESLEDLKKRMPSASIRNIILNLKDSNALGNNIVSTIRNQLDYMNKMRIMKIKEKINKMPIQVSVISVFLFIPIILLLILSPVLIEFLLS